MRPGLLLDTKEIPGKPEKGNSKGDFENDKLVAKGTKA
jgi:hypothetical protein